MSKTLFALAAIGLTLGTLGSGWLHGLFAHRGGDTAALQAAAASLNNSLPAQLGPWRLVKTQDIDPEVAGVLQCAAYLHGVYTNDQTGDTVVVAIVAGPSGPISVHTPEICYSSQDYEMAGQRQELFVTDRDGLRHAFWHLHANSRQATRPNLRVFYGWSQGDAWQATTGPRFAFAGIPVLYKLQLAGPPRGESADADTDPCHDFLSRFLTQLQPRLVRSARLRLLNNS